MSRLAVFIAQALLVLVVSGGVVWVCFDYGVPWLYLVMGIMATMLAIGLMFSVEAEHLEITFGYVCSVGLIGLGFGVFWPTLPIIAAWGALRRRREIAHYRAHVARESQDNHPEGPQGS